MGEKSEGFMGTIINYIWQITSWVKTGEEDGKDWGGGEEWAENYLNKDKKC